MTSERDGRWVRLKRLRGRRAWRTDVAAAGSGAREATLVRLLGRDDEALGWGWFRPRARLAVRLLTRDEAPPDDAWFRAQLEEAVALRREDPEIPDEACRLVHAEGDDLPGLTLDRYGDVLAARAYTEPALEVFLRHASSLHALLGTRHHRAALDAAAAAAEGVEARTEVSSDCPPGARFAEDGVRFEVSFAEAHKTGFFHDQRDNRRRLARLVAARVAAGRPPRVLDLCCYTGGFALHAAAAGAAEVQGVDLDEKALAQAQRNARINGAHGVRFTHADAFSWMRQMRENGRSWDVVVLDPPKLIASRREEEEGRARYHDFNKLAMPLVADDGWLVTCSCSGLLDARDFQELVRRAARLRDWRVMELTGAGRDHPVRIDFPEGRYLKALWLRAKRGSAADEDPEERAS